MVLVETASMGPKSLGCEANSLICINAPHGVIQTDLQCLDGHTVTVGKTALDHAHRSIGTKLQSWSTHLQMPTGFSDRAL